MARHRNSTASSTAAEPRFQTIRSAKPVSRQRKSFEHFAICLSKNLVAAVVCGGVTVSGPKLKCAEKDLLSACHTVNGPGYQRGV